MKVVIDGLKFKFKKKNAAEFYRWLSNVVHCLAVFKKRGNDAGLCDLLAPEFRTPEFIECVGDGGVGGLIIALSVDTLPALKKARRELALLSKVIL